MQTRNPILDDIAKVATGAASAFSGLRGEIEARVRDQMAKLLDGMHLPSREEFEVVKAMAAKAREENDELRARIAALEAKLAQIVIPGVMFEATHLGLVFEYLTQKSEELSGGKVVANFIYKGTDEEKTRKLVTLNLRNAPFTEVVRYVGQLTDTVFTYEEFAIVGKPAGAAPAPPATPTAPTGSSPSPSSSSPSTRRRPRRGPTRSRCPTAPSSRSTAVRSPSPRDRTSGPPSCA